jgi:hypothetical protein
MQFPRKCQFFFLHTLYFEEGGGGCSHEVLPLSSFISVYILYLGT